MEKYAIFKKKKDFNMLFSKNMGFWKFQKILGKSEIFTLLLIFTLDLRPPSLSASKKLMRNIKRSAGALTSKPQFYQGTQICFSVQCKGPCAGMCDEIEVYRDTCDHWNENAGNYLQNGPSQLIFFSIQS